MAELLLIARLAGRRIAFPAAEVEAVVEIEGLTPVPRAAPTSPASPRCAAGC